MSGRRNRVERFTNRAAGSSKAKDSASDSEDGHTCLICAEIIQYSAVSPCNNVTCHVCCFRQRALYEKKTCLVCRTDHEYVIFTEKPTVDNSQYAEFEKLAHLRDDKHGVLFTADYVQEDTEKLLDIMCPVCSENFKTFDKLCSHVREHERQYCDICGTHKKAFVSELKLYTQKQLQTHINEGDRAGFTGHPKCRFCRKRFYSDDELNVHIRDRHERCYLCDLDRHAAHDYYRNYDDLYSHFRAAHYVCSIPSCVEKRFVVFREDLDLTAHMLKEHGGIAGQNGRVVIGATRPQYQSQLLTFSRRNVPPDADSRDIKKRRLDERAKHYLNNDTGAIAKFNAINNQYRQRKVSAQQLVDEYQSLFTLDHLDIALLVYDLAELYPEHSEQKELLVRAYNSMSPLRELAESFPALGNGLLSISGASWGTGMGSKKSREEMFPALVKPSRSSTPVQKNPSVRYTAVVKQAPKPTKPTVTLNTFQGDSSFRPTYLESRSDSMPVLGSASLSRVQLPVAGGSQASLSEDKFPTLAKKNRREFPPVKPVVASGTWGLGLPLASPKVEDDWGIPVVDKKAEKLKRKQMRRKD